MGDQSLLLLIGLKILIIMKHCYFRYSGSPDVDRIIKKTRPKNIKMKEQCFSTWLFLSNMLIPSTSGDFEHPK